MILYVGYTIKRILTLDAIIEFISMLLFIPTIKLNSLELPRGESLVIYTFTY